MNVLFIQAVFIIFFAGCFFAALYRLWQGRLSTLPTLGWLTLMAFPFCLQFPLFNEQTRLLHGFCIGLVLIVMLACDLIADHISQRHPVEPQTGLSSQALKLAYGLMVFYILLTALHLYSADSIPYLELLTRGNLDPQITAERIRFSRNYAGLPAIKYLYSFSTYIFGVAAFLMLIRAKKAALAVFLGLWMAFYSVASTAKAPLVIALLVVMIAVCVIAKPSLRIKIIRSYVMIAIIVFLTLAVIDLIKPRYTVLGDLPEKYAAALDTRAKPDLMLGDYMRRIPTEEYLREVPKYLRMVDYYLYRVFITPVEVSARWFEYFHQYPVKQPIYGRLIADSRTDTITHPANAVGLWAYYERFPEHYTKDAYAYASIDADAYVRFGWPGLALALFIYAGMRLWLAVFSDNFSPTGGIFLATGLALLTFLPASASIQAMIVAHGLFALAFIMLALWCLGKYKKA